ncbi:hypothetical protein CTheo_8291 [Ceratobasidium theobromae]|uniref:Ribosomal protein bL31m N-terminal domain-containing protein n=1 Tax=Ceratobasidium theobromae TaxID=1582974 RepID=A0A5N5Q967_9AGAM|nr:hypothetical protein CTheo_8291 [Ceratobasidium theobromae]
MSLPPRSYVIWNVSRLARFRHSQSGSPYGRSHLSPKTPQLPNPVIPTYPQTVFLSDGSSFTHRTTAPRSVVRLTRDISNNPVWQPGIEARAGEEDDLSGRLGRYKRRFDDSSHFSEGELEGLMKEAKSSEKFIDKMRSGKPKHK